MSPVRPARLPHRLQAAAHAFAVVAGWGLFAWMWWLVARQSRHADDFWWLLIAALVVVPGITLAWVAHNKGLYRRLGPRRALREVEPDYGRDFNQRQVVADWAALGPARFIRVEVMGAEKRFRDVGALEGLAAPARQDGPVSPR